MIWLFLGIWLLAGLLVSVGFGFFAGVMAADYTRSDNNG